MAYAPRVLRFLGLTPSTAHKTGKREAAWMMFFVVLLLTIGFYVFDIVYHPDNTRDMTSVLLILWPAVVGAVGYAYGLEHQKQQHELDRGPDTVSADVPPTDFPSGN